MLIVEKISLYLFYLLLFKKNRPTKIQYLDVTTRRQSLVVILFRIMGIPVTELNFHLGNIEKSRNTSLYIGSVKLADSLARKISDKLMDEDKIDELNSKHGRKSIQLGLAKFYQIQLMDFCLRLSFLHSSKDKSNKCLIELPYYVDEELIKSFNEAEGIDFYSSPLSSIKDIYIAFIRVMRFYMRSLILVIVSWLKPVNIPFCDNQDITFSLKEDALHKYKNQRNQGFWVEDELKSHTYYVLDQSWEIASINSVSSYGSIHNLPISTVGLAIRKHRRDPRLLKVPNSLIKIIFRDLIKLNFKTCSAVLHIILLFLKSREIGAILIMLGANRFVFKETHGIDTDAIQLISKNIGLTTIGIQYSNLPVKNCLMDSTADKFLIFSELYKNIFSDKYFSPKEFIITGYPYRNVEIYTKSSAQLTRGSLHEKGVSLIIGYFDENIIEGKFSLTNKDHHYQDILKLAKVVLSDQSIAVIIKPQFTINTSKQYNNNSLITKAFKTGRLLELCRGNDRRNRVYPAEVGQICDICVGNILGGSASLEVAVIGRRSVMVNPYNVIPTWQNLFADKNILFQDLEKFLYEIRSLDNNDLLKTNIGDWSSILKNFDPYEDEMSFKRIQKAILN